MSSTNDTSKPPETQLTTEAGTSKRAEASRNNARTVERA